MVAFDMPVGTTLLRSKLHDDFGGARRGGMEPAPASNSMFLFTKPAVGHTYGYTYDGWHSDGTFHYTGDGQTGDQSLTTGGNKSLMDAEGLGRVVRLFRSKDAQTTYLGEFDLADPPFYRADAPDVEGITRSVLVFRLVPLGDVVRESTDGAVVDVGGTPEQIPVEATNVERYERQHPDEPAVAIRREALLVQRYVAWLEKLGQLTARHKVPLPAGGYLYTDVYNRVTGDLVEAKASSARQSIRSALGQILDYSRFVTHDLRSILIPERPSEDMITLLHSLGVGVIWEDKSGFQRSDP